MWSMEYEIEQLQEDFSKQMGSIDVKNLTDDFIEDMLLQSKPLQSILGEIRNRQRVSRNFIYLRALFLALLSIIHCLFLGELILLYFSNFRVNWLRSRRNMMQQSRDWSHFLLNVHLNPHLHHLHLQKLSLPNQLQLRKKLQHLQQSLHNDNQIIRQLLTS